MARIVSRFVSIICPPFPSSLILFSYRVSFERDSFGADVRVLFST